MIRNVYLTILLFGTLISSEANADHRVALLIDNSSYQETRLQLEATNLEKIAAVIRSSLGFRPTIARNLDDKQLQRTIEEFAATTPVRGTALIYFHGQAALGNYRGTSATCLLGINSKPGRGYSVNAALAALEQLGGSDRNLMVVDAPKANVAKAKNDQEGSFPMNSLLVFAAAEVFASGEDLLKRLHQEAGVRSTLTIRDKFGKAPMAVSESDRIIEGKMAGDEWVNQAGMVFCWCPPGRFRAGSDPSTPGRYDDEVQREVVINRGFWISKYEAALGGWKGNRHAKRLVGNKLYPINMVSQSKDIIARAIKPLNKKEREQKRLPAAWEYALPTEEQWEYAARAGSTGRFYFGDDLLLLARHANFADKSFFDSGDVFANFAHRSLDDGAVRLAKVGSYLPNAWGIHDVYGNVAEWCQNGVVRGGSWLSVGENCRSAYRDQRNDRDQEQFIGCRFVIQQRGER